MIVYNVDREWFPLKTDAEALRRQRGLPPSATFKLTIETREELAALLNGLTGIPQPGKQMAEVAAVPVEVIRRNQVSAVPDCVPIFLRKAWAKLMKEEVSE